MKTIMVILCFGSLALQAQNRYDVVISEIMADPSPPVSLPGNEWIELKNVSPVTINLQNWRIGDENGQSGPFPNFNLAPDSFVIICTGSALSQMQVYGRTIAVTGFPSLDNDQETIYLKSNNGMMVHAVAYSSSWYHNAVKSNGGWSLEMIDTRNPCMGMNNWKASTDVRGGTPGVKNSVDGLNPDQFPPSLLRSYSADSLTIIAVFDEPLDSLKASVTSNYSLNNNVVIQDVIPLAPLFKLVAIRLGSELLPNVIYELTVNNITDCSNNSTGSSNKTKAGWPVQCDTLDLVINEILFNPRAGGHDFVEFYNRSEKIIDVNKMFIANRNTNNSIGIPVLISPGAFYIFPGDHVAVTEDEEELAISYFVKDPARIIEITSLPTFADDEGVVILLNSYGQIIDEVTYKKEWQFALINNPEGVALERIDAAGPSQDKNNWHSAASTAGFGTPGYKNSQFRQSLIPEGKVEVNPRLFSPDNDGIDDITIIQYMIDEPGYSANVIIYDASGRIVRHLVNNAILGIEGKWTWDGLDEKGLPLSAGIYIIYSEFFNLKGKIFKLRNAVVIGRKSF